MFERHPACCDGVQTQTICWFRAVLDYKVLNVQNSHVPQRRGSQFACGEKRTRSAGAQSGGHPSASTVHSAAHRWLAKKRHERLQHRRIQHLGWLLVLLFEADALAAGRRLLLESPWSRANSARRKMLYDGRVGNDDNSVKSTYLTFDILHLMSIFKNPMSTLPHTLN